MLMLPQSFKQMTAIHQRSRACCAVPLADCAAYGNCTLAVYMGFSGSDQHGTTLNTASQIHQINQYSASTLYYRFTNSVRSPAQHCRGLLLLLSPSAVLLQTALHCTGSAMAYTCECFLQL